MTDFTPSGEPETSPPPTSRARRIAFCITELDPGGAEKGLFHLVTRLDRLKWTPRVYCLGPETELSKAMQEQGIAVECYGARSWRDLGALFWLTRHLNAFQPELLQGFLFHGNMMGRLAARLAGVPIVVAGHRVAEREKRWHVWLDRWTRRLVSHHVCVSRGVATFVIQQLRLQPNEVTVIPNGVAADELQESPSDGEPAIRIGDLARCPPTAPVILAVGRLHPQKGFLELLAAFEPVVAVIPECRLLIVGEGPQREELEKEIKQRNLEEQVTLAGWQKDVRNLMRQSRALALTSRWEGMPNVVLEAMSTGLPVVAMDVEGIRDIIPGEEYGFVVTQGDTYAFTQSLIQILTHPDRAAAMGDRSQHLVQKQFTLEQTASRYDELYQRLIN